MSESDMPLQKLKSNMETNLNYINMARKRNYWLYSSSRLQRNFFKNFSFEKTEDFHAFLIFSGIYVIYFPCINKNKYWLFVIQKFSVDITFIYSLSQISTSYTSSFLFVLMQIASQLFNSN